MANSFFDSVFGKAIEAFGESVADNVVVQDELFSKLPRLHKFFRMRYMDGRRYFTMADGPRLLSGLTAITKKIKMQRNEDYYLNEWKINMAKEGNDADEYAWMASEFGTLIHIMAADLFSARARKEGISTRGLDKQLREYMSMIGVPIVNFKDWYTNMCKALRSLNEFYSYTDMEVYAVEYCVADFENNVCTPLDIICAITLSESVDVPTKTGGTKKQKQDIRQLWNLNIKARKKSDRYSSDKYQICAEQYLFNNYSPEIKVERTGVLSPSWSWISKPDCKIHDFTGQFSERDWKWYLKRLKEEPGGIYNDMFNPDLNQMIGDTNIFSITEIGEVRTEPLESIADYITKHFVK